MRYTFAEFTLDTDAETLAGSDGLIQMRGRTYQLLRALVEHAPALVGRDQILDLVWGHDALSPNVLPQAISEIRHALGDNAQSPRFIETRHRRGYRLLVPVHRVEDDAGETMAEAAKASSTSVPAQRVDSPSALPTDAGKVSDTKSPVVRPASRRAWFVGLGVGIVAAIAIALMVWRTSQRPDAGDESTRPALAILAGSATAGPDWLPAVGSDLLTVALGNDDRLRLLRADGRAGGSAARADERWQVWLQEVLGADYALTGVWQRQDDQLSLTYSLLRLSDGRVAYSGTARNEDLAALCSEVARSLRRDLRLIDPGETWLSELPRAGEARQAYYRGLAALGEGAPGRAVTELERAMADAQAGNRVRLALATAYRQSGHLAQARTQFQQVLASNEPLSTGERLRLEAEAALVDHRPADAAASLRALHRLLPDDMGIGLALIDAQIRARQTQSAENTLAGLNRLSQGHIDDPRWHLAQARLAQLQNKPEQHRIAAEQALELAERFGRDELVVAAQLELAQAQRAEGDLAGARARLESMLDAGAPEALQAEVQVQLGSLLRDVGDFDGADRSLALALAGFVERGDRAGELRTRIEQHTVESERGHSEQAYQDLVAMEAPIAELDDGVLLTRYYNTIGVQATRNNRMDDAERFLQQAAAQARRAQQPAYEAGAYINLGQILMRNRRVDEAVAVWERALPVFRDSGDRMGEAITLSNLAVTSASQPGQQARSVDLNHRALEIFRELGAQQHRARTSFNLGLAIERQGDLAQADALFEESLSIYREGAGRDPVLSVAAALARVRLARAQTAAARELLGSVADDLEASAAPLAKSHIAAVWGQLESLAGDPVAARTHHERALALRTEAGSPGWQWLSEIELQRLDLQLGRDAESVRAAVERIAARQEAAGESRDELRSRLIEVAALLRLNRKEQARTILAHARALLADNPDAGDGFELDRLTILGGDGPASGRVARLRALADDAERSGFATLAQRCRLDADRLTASDSTASISTARREELSAAGLAGLLDPVP